MNIKSQLKNQMTKSLRQYYMKADRNEKNASALNYDRKGTKITLRELLGAMGEQVPHKFEDIADVEQNLSLRPQSVKKGDMCLVIRPAEDSGFTTFTTKDQYEIAIEKGACLIIMDRQHFMDNGLDEEAFPVVLVDKLDVKIYKFFWLYRERQQGTVVTITGSIGKTTTKDFCKCVSESRYRTYYSTGNANTIHSMTRHLIEEKNGDYEVYIQETGAGYPGSVRFASRIMRPDYFIITNVLNHHMQAYRRFDRLFNDKVSGDEYLSDDGKVIVNFDDDNLRNHRFIHDVSSFGIKQEDVDYRGINILQDNDILRFDVLERSTGTVTPMEIDIFGEHNVYNALAAFALGRNLGLTSEEISNALKKYSPRGVRQMLVNIGGRYIDMDCYNVAEESIMSMLRIGENFELEEGGRKFALIGGENKLGADLHERSEAFGEQLAEIRFDQFIFSGRNDSDDLALKRYGDALDISKGFSNKCSTPYEYYTTVEDVTKYLQKNVRRGDLLMCKGIFLLDFPISVDLAFGTSFSYHVSTYRKKEYKKENEEFKYNHIEEMGRAEILKRLVKSNKVIIPSEIDGIPVFRVGEGAFKGNRKMKKLRFEKGVRNIGAKAFMDCTGLSAVRMSGTIRVIEDEAFENCSSLTELTLPKRLTHIGEKAFAGCTELKKIFIPDSVGMIGEDAFEGDDNLVILCRKGSYAYDYAEENDIKVEIAPEEEE